jgi:hypothetical protein
MVLVMVMVMVMVVWCWHWRCCNQRFIRSRLACIVASTSFAAAAARRAAFGAEVLHRGISMGDPLSKVASDLENSKQSCVRNFLHPFQQRSCNWTLTRITSAARLGWRVFTGDGKFRHGHFLGGVSRCCAYKTPCLPCCTFW